jgi:hypothetical protein
MARVPRNARPGSASASAPGPAPGGTLTRTARPRPGEHWGASAPEAAERDANGTGGGVYVQRCHRLQPKRRRLEHRASREHEYKPSASEDAGLARFPAAHHTNPDGTASMRCQSESAVTSRLHTRQRAIHIQSRSVHARAPKARRSWGRRGPVLGVGVHSPTRPEAARSAVDR